MLSERRAQQPAQHAAVEEVEPGRSGEAQGEEVALEGRELHGRRRLGVVWGIQGRYFSIGKGNGASSRERKDVCAPAVSGGNPEVVLRSCGLVDQLRASWNSLLSWLREVESLGYLGNEPA